MKALFLSSLFPIPCAAFSFYVLGNGPYSTEERTVLQTNLRQLGDYRQGGDAQFIVHLGDIIPPKSDCSQDRYADVYNMFIQNSLLPVLVLPGDDDWIQCDLPDVAWRRWAQFFVQPPLEGTWWAVSSVPEEVERQDGRKENFAFRHDGVLFLGLNAPARSLESSIPQEQWDRLHDENVNWVHSQLQGSFGNIDLSRTGGILGNDGDRIRAVILFGHSIPDQRLFDVLLQHLQMSTVHVAYIHSHGRSWVVDQPYSDSGWERFWTVQIDSGSSASPLQVTVRADESDGEWEADNAEKIILGDVIKIHHSATVEDNTGSSPLPAFPMPSPGETTSPAPNSLSKSQPVIQQSPTVPFGASPTPTPSVMNLSPEPQPAIATPVATPPSTYNAITPIDTSLTNTTASNGLSNLEANVLLELRWVSSLMNSDVQDAFEIMCDVFLTELYMFTTPSVYDIKCQVLDQAMVIQSRMLSDVLEGTTTAGGGWNGTQENIMLDLSLRVLGTSASPSDSFDFGASVVDFFNVLGGQFAAQLKGDLGGANGDYFILVWNVKATEEVQTGANEGVKQNEGASGDSSIPNVLFWALVVVGGFVAGSLLAVLILYRKQKLLARRYADIGDSGSRFSHKIGIARAPSSSDPTAGPFFDPPSIVMQEGASDVDSMSRLQDFESITSGQRRWGSSIVTPGVEEDARTESSTPVSEDGRKTPSRQGSSIFSAEASLPSLASGALPSLAAGGVGSTVSELSRNYSAAATARSSPLADQDKRTGLIRIASGTSLGSGSLPTIASGAPPSLAGFSTMVQDFHGDYSTTTPTKAVSASPLTSPLDPRAISVNSVSANYSSGSSGGTHQIHNVPYDRPPIGAKSTSVPVTSGTFDDNDIGAMKSKTDSSAMQSPPSGDEKDSSDWFQSMVSDAFGDDIMEAPDSSAAAVSAGSAGGGIGESLRGAASRRRSAARKRQAHTSASAATEKQGGVRRGLFGFGGKTPLISNKEADKNNQQLQLAASAYTSSMSS